MAIRVTDDLEIPEDALTFTASRSGGPGGQHVNKTSSRVTLRMDVVHAPFLTEGVRGRLMDGLRSRIAKDGTIGVVCQSSRSQAANRRLAQERLVELLARALAPRAPRVETKVPRGEKARRRETKLRRSRIKRQRGIAPADDD